MLSSPSLLELFQPSKRGGTGTGKKGGRMLVVSYGDPSMLSRDNDWAGGGLNAADALSYGGFSKPTPPSRGLYQGIPEATLPDGTALNINMVPKVDEMVIPDAVNRFGDKIIGSGLRLADGQEKNLERANSTYFAKKTAGIPVTYNFPPPPPPPEAKPPRKLWNLGNKRPGKPKKPKAKSDGTDDADWRPEPPSSGPNGRLSLRHNESTTGHSVRTRSPPRGRASSPKRTDSEDPASFHPRALAATTSSRPGTSYTGVPPAALPHHGNTVAALPVKEPHSIRTGLGRSSTGHSASTSQTSAWDSSTDIGLDYLPPRKMTVQERLAFLRTTAAFIPTAKTNVHLRAKHNQLMNDPATDSARTPTIAERLALKKTRHPPQLATHSGVRSGSSMGSSHNSLQSRSQSMPPTPSHDSDKGQGMRSLPPHHHYPIITTAATTRHVGPYQATVMVPRSAGSSAGSRGPSSVVLSPDQSWNSGAVDSEQVGKAGSKAKLPPRPHSSVVESRKDFARRPPRPPGASDLLPEPNRPSSAPASPDRPSTSPGLGPARVL